AADRPLVEKTAVEVQHDTGKADRDCEPADEMADVAPDDGRAPAEDQADRKKHRRSDRKIERHVLGRATKVVLRVREENIPDETGEIRDGEELDQQLAVADDAPNVHDGAAVLRLAPSSPPCAPSSDSCRATGRSRRRP